MQTEQINAALFLDASREARDGIRDVQSTVSGIAMKTDDLCKAVESIAESGKVTATTAQRQTDIAEYRLTVEKEDRETRLALEKEDRERADERENRRWSWFTANWKYIAAGILLAAGVNMGDIVRAIYPAAPAPVAIEAAP